MAITYQGSGTRDQDVGTATLTPSYAASPADGDLWVLRTQHVNSVTQLGAVYTWPGDWTLRSTMTQSSSRLFIHTKVSDGTETGTISISTTGGSGSGHSARIDLWRGVDTTTNDGIYAGAVSQGNGTAINDAAVTTTAADRKSVV